MKELVFDRIFSRCLSASILILTLLLGGCERGWVREGERSVEQLRDVGVFEGKLALDKALDADLVCLVPEGVAPVAALETVFKKQARYITYDSENYWFILAMNDDKPDGRIVGIKLTKINMNPDAVRTDAPETDLIFGDLICGSDMYVVTKSINGKDSLFIKSINQKQP